MPIETARFIRKTFNVEAIQVTDENMAEVADWCGGEVTSLNGEGMRFYIVVPTLKAKTFRPNMAFAGGWVLKTGLGFTVYTRKGFTTSFEPRDENKFEAVRKLVKEAMSRQDEATYHDVSSKVDGLDEEIAHQIFELI